MKFLIENIKELIQVEDNPVKYVSGHDMRNIKTIRNAFVFVKDGIIEDFGSMDSERLSELKSTTSKMDIIDSTGKMVLPTFVDSHTHLVFPASREIEYIDKIKGLSYEEIAERGGGILNSARLMQEASEEELIDSAMERLDEIISYGTCAVEIKSGYGLTLDSEIKMLRVIKQLKEKSPLTIKATFLGAHSIPMEYRGNQEKYVDMVINEMLPIVAEQNLADYIDVFCDKGFFTVKDTERILEAGVRYGIRGKIHANELDYSGGIQAGVKHGALSVDHLEFTGDDEIKALINSDTMPTVLPGAAFFLGMKYAPVREMMDAGLPIALATDFNPGSSPSGNMQLIISMASILYKMLPEEAINAATINSAYAMGVSDQLGSIAIGKKANLIITKEIPTVEYLPYYYGTNKVETVILNGHIVTVNS